jgi:hypothetical protein
VKSLSFFPRKCRLSHDTLNLTCNINCRRGIIMRKAPRVHCSDKSSSLGDSKMVNEHQQQRGDPESLTQDFVVYNQTSCSRD